MTARTPSGHLTHEQGAGYGAAPSVPPAQEEGHPRSALLRSRAETIRVKDPASSTPDLLHGAADELDRLSRLQSPPVADAEIEGLVKRLSERQGEYAEQGSANVMVMPPDYDALEAASALSAQQREIAKLKTEIELRKRSAARFQLCGDHNGKLPLDGECVMCFTERNERNRNRRDFGERAEVAESSLAAAQAERDAANEAVNAMRRRAQAAEDDWQKSERSLAAAQKVVEAAEATLEDEQVAHQETLELWARAKTALIEITEVGERLSGLGEIATSGDGHARCREIALAALSPASGKADK